MSLGVGDYLSGGNKNQPKVEVIGVDYREPYKDKTPRTPSYYSEKEIR